ncbi:uncharacterized protein B0T23DRAFT_399244 [Neurospora hispaniola]|uniref:Uncharacterized protein n=1 Tax=Neurospora hispaniola TaxID=588809 RepID=A0AAJ0MMZ6_9PEZI|nr:hypothetical protein B0T23DRAFT_399244 [Neurospora hispaniola]
MAYDVKESMALDKVVKTLMPRLAGIRRNMVGKEMMLGISDFRLLGFFVLNTSVMTIQETHYIPRWSSRFISCVGLQDDIAISIGLVGSKSPQGLGRRAKPLTTRSAGWQIQRQGNANNGRQPSRQQPSTDPNPSVQPHTK